jgi:hypothetical protein
MGVLIVGGDEGIDLFAQLTWRGEAGIGQGPARQDGEPDFDLIEPRGMGRSEMKMDVLVAGQPAINQVVEDDMSFPVGMVSDDAVHEVQEFDSPTALVMAGFDQTGLVVTSVPKVTI